MLEGVTSLTSSANMYYCVSSITLVPSYFYLVTRFEKKTLLLCSDDYAGCRLVESTILLYESNSSVISMNEDYSSPLILFIYFSWMRTVMKDRDATTAVFNKFSHKSSMKCNTEIWNLFKKYFYFSLYWSVECEHYYWTLTTIKI